LWCSRDRLGLSDIRRLAFARIDGVIRGLLGYDRVVRFARALRLLAVVLGLRFLGECEITGVALDGVDKVFDLTRMFLLRRNRRQGLSGFRRILVRFKRRAALDGARVRRGWRRMLDAGLKRLVGKLEMPDRVEIGLVAPCRVDQWIERFPIVLSMRLSRRRRFVLRRNLVMLDRRDRLFARLRYALAEGFRRFGGRTDGCELREQGGFVFVRRIRSDGEVEGIGRAIVIRGLANALDALRDQRRALAARCRRERVELGQQRQLHRQQALVGGLDNAKRPVDFVLRLPRGAQRGPQPPPQRIVGVEILQDLDPRAAVGLLERGDGVQFFCGRFQQLGRQTIELVLDGLKGRGRVSDRGFARLTRTFVQGDLPPGLSVALGVQLRHGVEKRVELNRRRRAG